MCFSKETSIGSLVYGTILNFICALLVLKLNYKDKNSRIAILLLWQFALLMQIPEAVQWHYMDQGLAPPSSTKTAAFWLNVLQPICALLVFSAVRRNDVSALYMAFAAMPAIVFTGVAVAKSPYMLDQKSSIAPTTGCDHLDLFWWNSEHDVNIQGELPLYMFGLLGAIMLLPFRLRIIQASIVLGTFLLSAFIYKCGYGSVWCWMVASAGISVLIP